MAFCKVCLCGEKIVFERPMSFPDNCPSCGRRLVDFPTYTEDDPKVNEQIAAVKKNNDIGNNDDVNEFTPNNTDNSSNSYCLKFKDEKKIIIPDNICIIGRTETGAEELSEYPSVSRQHIRVIPRRGGVVIIEDISSFGTLVNGQRLEKNAPTRISVGDIVTLCNVDLQLVKGSENL